MNFVWLQQGKIEESCRRDRTPVWLWQAEGRGTVCGQGEVWADSKVLAGMGELQLELGRDRLQGDEGLTKPLGFIIWQWRVTEKNHSRRLWWSRCLRLTCGIYHGAVTYQCDMVPCGVYIIHNIYPTSKLMVLMLKCACISKLEKIQEANTKKYASVSEAD